MAKQEYGEVQWRFLVAPQHFSLKVKLLAGGPEGSPELFLPFFGGSLGKDVRKFWADPFLRQRFPKEGLLT